MSTYSPITVTPIIPIGDPIVLPMPDAVESTANTVVFEFVDPMNQTGNPINIETLVAPITSGTPDRIQQDIRRDGKRQVQTDPPATLVNVSWSEIEHYTNTPRLYSAIGALAISGKRWNKGAIEGMQISVILYRADAIWTHEGVLE